MINCETCGQSGIHIACGNLEKNSPCYICKACNPEVKPDTDTDDSEEEAEEVSHLGILRTFTEIFSQGNLLKNSLM